MIAQTLLDRARTLGESAGRGFVATGIWPRCPFRGVDDTNTALAVAWTDGVFSVTGPALAPTTPPSTE